MIRSTSKFMAAGVLTALSLPLAACGETAFSKEVTPICLEQLTAEQCSCIVSGLDDGLPDRVKTAFVALRWELRPDPKDRERVNNAALRAAGVDPADRQAVQSIRSEFRDTYYPLRDKLSDQCGASL
jgi:hypothetical protein